MAINDNSRSQAIREIRKHSDANRAIKVEPYTFARWAASTKISEIEAAARKNRAIRVQPYTFTRWLAMLEA